MNLLKQMTAFLVVALVLGTAGCSKSSSDAAITDRVKSAIAKAPELKGTKVSVATTENVVHLGGTVKSRAERAMLIAVARKVEGVKAVKTDVVVTPQQTARIKPQQKSGIKPQQKTGVKPQQKPAAEARAKREPRAQVRVASPGAGVPAER
jgi:hypothetical protein